MRHEARATESGGDETPPGPAVLPSAEARERLPPEEPASEHTERRLGKSKRRRHRRFPRHRPPEERP